jgi:hypothetical protein
MGTRLELPDELGGHVARALLQLRDNGRFDTESLGTNNVGGSMVCRDLETLGWPVKSVPGSRPEAWELRAGSAREEAQKRFQSRAFAEWEAEAVAKLTGAPAPQKPKKVATSTWSAADYTGTRGAKLSTPLADTLALRLLYSVIHLDRATPELVDLQPLAFVAAAQQLEESGWPVVLDRVALKLSFDTDVSTSVIDSWRSAFGARGRSEALTGTLGVPSKQSGYR